VSACGATLAALTFVGLRSNLKTAATLSSSPAAAERGRFGGGVPEGNLYTFMMTPAAAERAARYREEAAKFREPGLGTISDLHVVAAGAVSGGTPIK
jgi:hypothetical protein